MSNCSLCLFSGDRLCRRCADIDACAGESERRLFISPQCFYFTVVGFGQECIHIVFVKQSSCILILPLHEAFALMYVCGDRILNSSLHASYLFVSNRDPQIIYNADFF